MMAFDSIYIPPARTTVRRSTFSGGEVVRHYGEPAVVIKFSRSRGLRLQALDGSHGWYAEPEECEPLY